MLLHAETPVDSIWECSERTTILEQGVCARESERVMESGCESESEIESESENESESESESGSEAEILR